MGESDNLENLANLYSLFDLALGRIKKLSEYFGKTCDAALNCVLTSPFSREISKEYHNQYVIT